MSSPELYIDVDGVLLRRAADPTSPGLSLSLHADEFLEFALGRFRCFWLTTHCKDGDATHVLRYLRPYCTDAVFKLIQQVKPTTWTTLKTELLDPDGNFWWVDDEPLAYEIQWLKDQGSSDRWIEVNTNKRPDDLLRAMEFKRFLHTVMLIPCQVIRAARRVTLRILAYTDGVRLLFRSLDASAQIRAP